MKAKNERVKEVFTGHKPVPMKIANKVMNSVCKITIKLNAGNHFGTGFFMNISDSLKSLVTNYHIINEKILNKNIEIKIWNEKKTKLNLNNRFYQYFDDPIDITVIEMKDSDEIYKYIEFLDYDINYIRQGYLIYKDADVFSIEHPCGDDAECASGKIIKVYNYEFDHDIPTDNGSSGCPILLLSKNINFVKIIGIHKNSDRIKKINGGTFIGEIIKLFGQPLLEKIGNLYNKRDNNIINTPNNLLSKTKENNLKINNFDNNIPIKINRPMDVSKKYNNNIENPKIEINKNVIPNNINNLQIEFMKPSQNINKIFHNYLFNNSPSKSMDQSNYESFGMIPANISLHSY